MEKLPILLALLATVCTAHGWQPGPASCECFNLLYVDRPSQIAECYSKATFLNQIHVNYNNLQLALLINGSPYRCDFAVYKQRINGMKTRTLQLVEAYFACTETNCTAAVMAAYQKFVEYRTDKFNPFTRCSFTNFNVDCAQVLMQNRPVVYGSAENILVALLACSKLKSETHCGTQETSSSSLILPKNKETECNCLKIDPRPIPTDVCECFSTKYIAKLRKFIEINFARVVGNYNAISSTCDYTQFYGYIEQLKGIALASTKLLDKASPKMAELEEFNQQYFAVLAKYNPAVREYILDQDKTCYFNVRKSRVNPLATTDAVIGILTKCIGFVDLSQHFCSNLK